MKVNICCAHEFGGRDDRWRRTDDGDVLPLPQDAALFPGCPDVVINSRKIDDTRIDDLEIGALRLIVGGIVGKAGGRGNLTQLGIQELAPRTPDIDVSGCRAGCPRRIRAAAPMTQMRCWLLAARSIFSRNPKRLARSMSFIPWPFQMMALYRASLKAGPVQRQSQQE